MIEITIIIPVYNEIKTINKLLEKVINLEIKKQIIVIDDASIDGTKEYLLANQDKLDKLICHEKNVITPSWNKPFSVKEKNWSLLKNVFHARLLKKSSMTD